MNISTNHDPLAVLYTLQEAPFPGYKAEGQFEHGKPVIVARIPEMHAGGYPSIISEKRYPASCMSAVITDRGYPVLKLETGSGSEIALLLHRVCTALANGSVQFTPSLKFPHSVGIGIGRERVMLCFADKGLCLDTVGNLNTGMLTIEKIL